MSEPVKLIRPRIVAPSEFAPLAAPAGDTTIWRAIRELWEIRPCWVCGMYGHCPHREPEADAAWLEAKSRKL